MSEPDAKNEPVPPEHWSRARADSNRETIDFLRERSRAPGVAEGGAERNHYCLECNGVIPLHYDRRNPAAGPPESCPHCGATLDQRVRAMFNWVEIDQVPPSDAGPLLRLAGLVLGGIALLVLAVLGLLRLLA
jgi:hypothetical protein